MKMRKNMGTLDKTLRLIVAAIAVVLAASGMLTGILAIIAYVLAAVFVVTSFVSFCPLYRLVGLRTCANC
jgi:mannose/fructose/N-acetylgalactosamine-specific phosphotransferase system component IID